MVAILQMLWPLVVDLFKPRWRLQAENLFLRHQLGMGIRDRPIALGSPWQNPDVERLIGTVRTECLDRMLIFGESHLRRVLSSCAGYYNQVRTHLALD